MAFRWSIPDTVFKLDNEFHKEAMLLIASLKPPDVDADTQKRLERIMELSDLLTLAWQKAYPVVDGKEFKHLDIESVLTNPIRN